MSTGLSWVLVGLILGSVALFVLAVDRWMDHWWQARQDAARLRHPSVVRHYCPSCGDRNVLHMGMHTRLCHGTPAEDRPDWGQS